MYKFALNFLKKKFLKKYSFLNEYKSLELLEKYLGKKYDYFEEKKRNSFIKNKDIIVRDRFALVPLFCSILKKNKVKFLEFGGGNNPIFLYIRKVTKKKLQCQVLEHSFNIISVPAKFKSYISYISDLKKIRFNNLDFVYFGSSLQYFQNYEEILKMVFFHKVPYIFITGTFFSKFKDNKFVLQVNRPESKYKNHRNSKLMNIFFSLKKLDNFFLVNKYEKIYMNLKDEPKLNHNFFSKGDYFSGDLIYRRIT